MILERSVVAASTYFKNRMMVNCDLSLDLYHATKHQGSTHCGFRPESFHIETYFMSM